MHGFTYFSSFFDSHSVSSTLVLMFDCLFWLKGLDKEGKIVRLHSQITIPDYREYYVFFLFLKKCGKPRLSTFLNPERLWGISICPKSQLSKLTDLKHLICDLLHFFVCERTAVRFLTIRPLEVVVSTVLWTCIYYLLLLDLTLVRTTPKCIIGTYRLISLH